MAALMSATGRSASEVACTIGGGVWDGTEEGFVDANQPAPDGGALLRALALADLFAS